MDVLTKLKILFCVLTNIANQIQGTGIVTQLTVVSRAHQYFNSSIIGDVDYNKILRRNYGSVVSGAVFPDAFLECAGAKYKHVSEDTHYGGFLNASINYIRNHYPQPWNNDTEKLVAFVMGVASKQVSTMLWESIGVRDGFVQAQANVNFHGSHKEAQKSARIGADAVILFKSTVDYLEITDWYFPVDDLFKIYQEYYGTVKIPADVIDNCTTFQVLEAIVELTLLFEAYHEVADISPFLVDETKDYFLGGLNDMAKWTQIIWSETILMLQNGTESCDINKNTLFINCNKQRKIQQPVCSNRQIMSDTVPEELLLASSDVTMDDIIITKSKHGKSLQITGKLQDTVEKIRKFKHNDKQQEYQSGGAPQYLYYSNHTYSELGWSMAVGDVDGDGNEDLVAGSPGYSTNGDFLFGRVYIMYSTDEGIPRSLFSTENVEQNRTYTSYFSGQSKAYSLYGSSVALVDINLDGVLDLAVGAPSFSNSGSLGYNGIVYVYFGQPKKRLVQHNPDITITCQITNCNLGYSLAVVDYNKDGHEDLMLGTPFYSKELNQSGIVSALPSSSSYTGLKTFGFENLIANFSLQSKQEYSWFGYSMKAKDNVLLVSQPYFRKCGSQDCRLSPNDTQGIGAVTLYNFGTKLKHQGFTYSGEKEFDMAGAGADFGYPYQDGKAIFAIGIPGASVYGSYFGLPIHFRQGGTVRLYDISGTDVKLVANFDGDRMHERFGKNVLCRKPLGNYYDFTRFPHIKPAGIYCFPMDDLNSDGADDLVFSATERTGKLVTVLEEGTKISGTIYMFFGGTGFPVGNETYSNSRCRDKLPCPQLIANITTTLLLGSAQSIFGEVMTLMKDKTSNSLVISSEVWESLDYGFLDPGFVAKEFSHINMSIHP